MTDTKICLKDANEHAEKVVDACIKHFEDNKKDCNNFLKAVAKELGIKDFEDGDDADKIIERLEASPEGWTKLKRGDNDDAHKQAVAGNFVVAGLTSKDMSEKHGHVAVATSGEMVFSGSDQTSYPRGFWGTLGSEGKDCEGLNYSFGKKHRKNLRYYYKKMT